MAATQFIMGFINTIDDAEDPKIKEDLKQAKIFAGVGAAGPGVVAGTMLIVYRIAMALFIGFGPIFILALLFKKTAPLFTKWLYYGLATIFSSVLLAVMADIALDLTLEVAKASFIMDATLGLIGIESSGVMQAATQQLGLGLILSTLLIVVPPMAGMWFNGVMGNFSTYSSLTDRWNNNNPTTSGTGNPSHDVMGNRNFQGSYPTNDIQLHNISYGMKTKVSNSDVIKLTDSIPKQSYLNSHQNSTATDNIKSHGNKFNQSNN